MEVDINNGTSTVQVSALTAAHLPQLTTLYSHLHKQDTKPELEQIAAVWEEIEKNKTLSYFGAFEGEQLLSSCHIVVVPNLTRSCRPYAVIENVVTHASYRGQGYGKAVVKAAIDYAWLQGCYKVMLITGRSDSGVHQFYKALGFSGDGKQAYVLKQNGI